MDCGLEDEVQNLTVPSDPRPRLSEPLINTHENGVLQKALPRVSFEKPFRTYRSKSMYGDQPSSQFGPKAHVLNTQESLITVSDPFCQQLKWETSPSNFLIIRKIQDDQIREHFVELIQWLTSEKRFTVFVEKTSYDDALVGYENEMKSISESQRLLTFEDGKGSLENKIDLIITMGGDGTLLYASSLFPNSVPPIMSFHLGSLGFLSQFNFAQYKPSIENVLQGHVPVPLCLRMRLKCVMSSCDSPKLPSSANKSDHMQMVMNEIVVDRGPSAYLCFLDLYVNSRYVTSVQGDGLIISTPTGSTAYAAAAGASMVHPNVPAIVVAPICPHSLSFRPIVIPAGVEVQIAINEDSRENAWISFDGRSRKELKVNDVLRICTSRYPIPSISATNQMQDWFDSLASCLHWNVRKPQKSLTNLSQNGTPPSDR